jgi:hypothetical protein
LGFSDVDGEKLSFKLEINEILRKNISHGTLFFAGSYDGDAFGIKDLVKVQGYQKYSFRFEVLMTQGRLKLYVPRLQVSAFQRLVSNERFSTVPSKDQVFRMTICIVCALSANEKCFLSAYLGH